MLDTTKKKGRQPKQFLNAYPTLDSSTNTGFAVDAIPNVMTDPPVTFVDQPYDGCVYGGSHSIDLSECVGFD